MTKRFIHPKLYVFDVSINSSEKTIRDYIDNILIDSSIAVFDSKFCFYQSTNEFLHDLECYPKDFFCKPASYYDCVIGILAHARKTMFDEIIILSPQFDDCSMLSDEDMFINYIYHYRLNHKNITFEDYNFSSPSTLFERVKYKMLSLTCSPLS